MVSDENVSGYRVPDQNVWLTHLCLSSHKRTVGNSVDSDHVSQNAASDQDLHCLHLLHEFLQKNVIMKINKRLFLLRMKICCRRVHMS